MYIDVGRCPDFRYTGCLYIMVVCGIPTWSDLWIGQSHNMIWIAGLFVPTFCKPAVSRTHDIYICIYIYMYILCIYICIYVYNDIIFQYTTSMLRGFSNKIIYIQVDNILTFCVYGGCPKIGYYQYGWFIMDFFNGKSYWNGWFGVIHFRQPPYRCFSQLNTAVWSIHI